MGFLFENGLQISLELGNKYNNHNNPCALKWTSLNIGNHVQLSRSHKSPSLFSVAFCIHCKVWTAVVRDKYFATGRVSGAISCMPDCSARGGEDGVPPFYSLVFQHH